MTSLDARNKAARVAERGLLAMLFTVPLTVTWTVAGVHIAIGCGAVCAVTLGVLSRRWPLRRTVADRAWMAWALACLLAALFAIPEARSWQPMKKVLLIPLAHVAAFGLATGTRARWAVRLLVWAMALTAAVAMLLFWTVSRPDNGRLAGFSHYMTFAGQILLVLPAAACAAWASRGRLRQVYVVCTAVLALALAMTFTRSAWLGTMLAAVLITARVRPRLVWLVPVLLALLLLVAPQRYRERALSSFNPSHPVNLERQKLWGWGVAIWRDHPWTGVGLGDLIPVNRMYAAPGEVVVHGHLHNNVLQVLATRGLVGLVAFLWLQMAFARLVWRARSVDAEMAALLLGLWGSLWGFELMGLFEWNFGDVEVMIPLYFLLGVAATQQVLPGAGTRGTPALFQEPTEPQRPSPNT